MSPVFGQSAAAAAVALATVPEAAPLASREPELAAGISEPALLALQAASPRAPPGLPLPLPVALPPLSAEAAPAAPALLGDSRMRPLLALVACQRD